MAEDSTELPKTTEADWLKWATNPSQTVEWVRNNAGNLQLDAQKYIFGLMINTIRSDDSTSFALPLSPDAAVRGLTDSNIVKNALIERLSWEETLPELPDDLKERINQYKKQVINENWNNSDIVSNSKQIWEKQVKGFIDEQLRDEDDYGLAQIFFEDNEDRVDQERNKIIK